MCYIKDHYCFLHPQTMGNHRIMDYYNWGKDDDVFWKSYCTLTIFLIGVFLASNDHFFPFWDKAQTYHTAALTFEPNGYEFPEWVSTL